MFYFWYGFRGVLREPLILAGEQLEDHSVSIYDTAIGVLAQVIGFWWGDEDHENFCVTTCEELLRTLNTAAKVFSISQSHAIVRVQTINSFTLILFYRID